MIDRRTWTLFTASLSTVFTVVSPAHAREPKAIVWVADDGGLGAEAAKSSRRIASAALNERGVETAEPAEADGVHPFDDEARRIATDLDIEKSFVLRLSRLGDKIVVTATLYDSSFTAVRSRQMTAEHIEDLDTVVPRLVLSVEQNTSTSARAEVDTVSDRETEPWNKKPGEFLFGLGILLAGGFHEDASIQYGLDFKISYEMKYFRINGEIAGAAGIPEFDDALARVGLGVTYLPFARDWSPYVGASLNYMFAGVSGEYSPGVGITPHIGVEGFRLHSVRFLVELGVTLPIFRFDDFYAPIGHGSMCVLW
jgi:hypothetical protein